MLTDIEIAQSCEMQPIGKIAEKLNIPEEMLEPYGRYKAKVDHIALGISGGIEADVARVRLAVGRKIFAELQIDLPPALAAYPELYRTR